MQVKQQQMPQSGEQVGDAKQSIRYGRETTICQIWFAAGIVVFDDGGDDDDERRGDVVVKCRGDDDDVCVDEN
jgi:hypothetical protein